MEKSYTGKERNLVKAYILEQYAQKTDAVELFSSSDPEIQVLKIVSNKHVTYITLGAGAYTISNKFRKDLQNFEFVMVASKCITKEQENYILQNIPMLFASRVEKGHAPLELDIFDWVEDSGASPFVFEGFMMLRSAEPLDIPKRHINFMALLPLYRTEIDSFWNRLKSDGLFDKLPHQTMQDHKGAFFKTLTDLCGEKEILYIDGTRKKSPYGMYNVAESAFGYKNVCVKWTDSLKNARALAVSFWQDMRNELTVIPQKKPVSKTFKYEEYSAGISIKGYIGTDLEVVIPEEMNGKPVTRIEWRAFSPENLAEYSRAKEVRRMLKKVTILAPLRELQWSAFDGCESLEEVVLASNVCIDGFSRHSFPANPNLVFWVEEGSWAEQACKECNLKYNLLKSCSDK